MRLLFIEPFLTPLLFLMIFIVAVIALFTIYSFYRKEKKYEEKREKTFVDYDTILASAHQKAEQILERASEEATEIKHEHTDIDKKVTKDIQDAFQRVLQDNMQLLIILQKNTSKNSKMNWVS